MEQFYHVQTEVPTQQVASGRVLTRRQSLKWLGMITAGLSLPLISGCERAMIEAAKLAGDWPDLDLEPITGQGYGTDPDLINPPKTPWPLTLSHDQRELVSVLVDILFPPDGEHPAASEVGVTDLIDEWVSAPYPDFQSSRVEILSALAWLDEEATRRFDRSFVKALPAQRLEIIDDIAYEEAESTLRFAYISRVFDAMRTLIVIAYFASPEGTKQLGYQGNVPIAGDYPGPTPEAITHLNKTLNDLELAAYAYKEA